jgi:hypothetical protein
MIAEAEYPAETKRMISAKCAILMELLCEAVLDGPEPRHDANAEHRHFQRELV